MRRVARCYSNTQHEAVPRLRAASSSDKAARLRYIIFALVVLVLYAPQAWGATPAASGTYTFADQTIGAKEKFYKISNGVFQYRMNSYTKDAILGIQIQSTVNTGTGFAVYLSTAMDLEVVVKKKSVKNEVPATITVYSVTNGSTAFQTMEEGTNNSTTVSLTLGASAYASDNITFPALASAATAETTTGTMSLAAGYYYIEGVCASKNAYIYSISLSGCSAPASVGISGQWHYFSGDNISLTATPTGGSGTVTTYQWYKNGTENENRIAGATSATYSVDHCTFDDAGTYYCMVTKDGSCSTMSDGFGVKILRLYVNTGVENWTSYGYADFVKVSETTAVATIFLGAPWFYGFNIADGCGHYYGNSGDMTSANHLNWTMDNTSRSCGLTTTNGATYTFTVNYSDIARPVVSVEYPIANQAAEKTIYFYNSKGWTQVYYRKGHGTYSEATLMTLVPGTANLYKVTTTAFDGMAAWNITDNAGWTGSNSIYKTKTGDSYQINNATNFDGGAVTLDAITITPTGDGSMGGDDQNDNCRFYGYEPSVGMRTQRVEVAGTTNGAIRVDYTNTSGSAVSFTSGERDLAHSTIITISATPAAGYELESLTVNGADHTSGNTVTVTSETTIEASFTPRVYDIHYYDQGGTAFSGSHAVGYPTTHTYGTATDLMSATKTGYHFDGWYTASACTGSPVTSLGATAYTADPSLYAKWSEAGYSVTYADGGATTGTVPTDDNDYAGGATVTVLGNTGSLTKTGYGFRGWTDGTTFFLPAQTFTITADVTLTAVWDEEADDVICNIDFRAAKWTGETFAQGNTTTADEKYGIWFYSKSSSNQFSLTDNTTNGLTFPGNNLSSGNYYFCIPLTGINGEITVTFTHGYSSKTASYKYVYIDGRDSFTAGNTNSSGGTQVTDANQSDTQLSFTVTASQSKGHLCVGRYGSSFTQIYGVRVTTPGGSSNSTVRFAHGSVAPASAAGMPTTIVGVPAGKLIVRPSDPTADHCTFGGWYTDAACTNAWNWGSSTVTKDTTLYAKWTGESYAITYKDEGDVAFSGSHATGYPTSHTYGSATALQTATKAGKVFCGWYTASACTGSPVRTLSATGYTAAITLYAKWSDYKQFEKVTDADQLEEEDEVIIVYETGKVIGDSISGNLMGATDVGVEFSSPVGSYVNVATNAGYVFTLEASDDKWKLIDGNDGALAVNNTNKIEVQEGGDDWSISVASGNATIQSATTSKSTKTLLYNAATGKFTVYASAGGDVQNVQLYHYQELNPVIRVLPITADLFTYVEGYGPSAAQEFSITGKNLTGNLTLTIPSGYEVSTTSATAGFTTASQTFTKDASDRVSTTIWIRMQSGLAQGEHNGNAVVSGGGATTKNIALSGTVTGLPTGRGFVRVNSNADIHAGEYYLLVAESYGKGNGHNTVSNQGDFLDQTSVVTIEIAGEDVLYADDDAAINPFVVKGRRSGHTLYDLDNMSRVLVAWPGKKMLFKSPASITADTVGLWTINASDADDVRVTDASGRYGRIYYNSSDKRFNVYQEDDKEKSKHKPLQLYRNNCTTANLHFLCGATETEDLNIAFNGASYTVTGAFSTESNGTLTSTITPAPAGGDIVFDIAAKTITVTASGEWDIMLTQAEGDYCPAEAYCHVKATKVVTEMSIAGWTATAVDPQQEEVPADLSHEGENVVADPDLYPWFAFEDIGEYLDITDWDDSNVIVNMNGYRGSGTWAVRSENSGAWKSLLSGANADRTVTLSCGGKTQGRRVLLTAKGGETIDSQHYYTIPYTYNSSATLTSWAGGAESVLYVRGGTLTIDVDITAAAVWVSPAATLVINAGKTLTCDSLMLRTTDRQAAELVNNGTLAATKVHYTRIVRQKEYQQFALPFATDLSDVFLSLEPGGRKLAYGNWLVKYYDTESRATNGILADGGNWKRMAADGILEAGRGYEFYSNSAYYREFFFPVTYSKVSPSASTRSSLDCHTGSVGVTNDGWNFIASPFTSTYTPTPSPEITIAELAEDNLTYYQHVVTSLPPVRPFYYQAEGTGYMVFDAGMSIMSAAAQAAGNRALKRSEAAGSDTSAGEDLQWLRVILSTEEASDETNILLSARYTSEYELGRDVTKLLVEAGRPQIYSVVPCGESSAGCSSYCNLATAALNDMVSEIPLGLYLPEEGLYTLSSVPNDWQGRLTNLFLNDVQDGIVADLVATDYRYYAESRGSTFRFSLLPVFRDETPPDSGGTYGTATGLDGSALAVHAEGATATGTIVLSDLQRGEVVRLYDAAGRLLMQRTAEAEVMQVKIETAGIYTVQAGSKVKRILITAQ